MSCKICRDNDCYFRNIIVYIKIYNIFNNTT